MWAEQVDVDALLTGISPVVIYALVGVVIGLESMGIPLPGEVILVSSALLSSRQELDVSPVWVAAAGSAGAIIGDSIGYLAGRRWGVRMFDVLGRRFPKHAGPDHVAYSEHVFTRFGVLAVFFGRFVALLRIFAGPLAGALKMPYRHFFAANALGGIFWACGTTAVIYTLGAGAEQWLKGSSWIGLAIAAGFGIAASTVFRRRMEQAVASHASERRAHHAKLGCAGSLGSAGSQREPAEGQRGELVA